MSYVDKLNHKNSSAWRIELATQRGTAIDNATSEIDLSLGGLRLKREREFAALFTPLRPPMCGYNCFGHVLASRRTFFDEDAIAIHTVLTEDGTGEIPEIDIRPDDIVLYYFEQRPFHIARVARLEPLLVGVSAAQSMSILVTSKFDDVSGEYEHKVGDTRWSPFQDLTTRFFRERSARPQLASGGWRSVVS